MPLTGRSLCFDIGHFWFCTDLPHTVQDRGAVVHFLKSDTHSGAMSSLQNVYDIIPQNENIFLLVKSVE